MNAQILTRLETLRGTIDGLIEHARTSLPHDATYIPARLAAAHNTVQWLIDQAIAALPHPLPDYNIGGDCNGTSLQGYYDASYADLVALLGPPQSEGDGYKVSTEWVLTHGVTGEAVTLYDWKETNLYDDSLPTVETFRALPSYEWHIGARTKAAALALAAQLAAALQRKHAG